VGRVPDPRQGEEVQAGGCWADWGLSVERFWGAFRGPETPQAARPPFLMRPMDTPAHRPLSFLPCSHLSLPAAPCRRCTQGWVATAPGSVLQVEVDTTFEAGGTGGPAVQLADAPRVGLAVLYLR
jgi:hypothetical protein